VEPFDQEVVMRRQLSEVLLLGSVLAVWGCGSETSIRDRSTNGGDLGGSGGVTTGGTTASGGIPGSGGLTTTGGLGPIGGSSGSGGVLPTGGVGPTGSGGVLPTGGTGPTGGVGTGGQLPTGGTGPTGGVGTGGVGTGGVGTGGVGTGGEGTGGVGTGGEGTGGDGTGGEGTGGEGTGGDGTGGGGSGAPGPCDIYAEDGAPCVAAYSMVRRLVADYDGPLYQVRSGSSAQNTGTGGTVHDIGQTADGFADAAAQDAVCAGTVCSVSLLYDQTGNENNLPAAKKGLSGGGTYAASDDFESIADAGPLTVGGHNVYSLYMEVRQGYRSPVGVAGNAVPRGKEPQGIYELADGTHSGTACCWDFGNVSPDPTRYGVMNTLFFGVAYWGRGAGSGPWFMADYEAGVWAGGTNPSDPGWGSLDTTAPPNQNNPSLRVPFAIGFLKTNQTDWSLRMADLQTASAVTTAYAGGLPKQMNNEGGIVLGVGGDNSNNSWGTFFEGAIVSGFPSDDAELAVMQNVKAAGYGQ
jgi:hypothetical protein